MTCSDHIDADKTGVALNDQRFHMLEDIAQELSAGEVIFPTCFDAILRLREVLQDPRQSMAGISHAITLEPLISAKLLQLANSVAFNPQGVELVDLQQAITRLGLDTVRTTAMAIAMKQLVRAKSLAAFTTMARQLWSHSVQTAAAARVIARHLTRINPEQAMLTGLIHDLGAFYMLYRASQYEELRHRPESIRHIIIRWHESIGLTLLSTLGIPEEIAEATIDHDLIRAVPDPIRSLSDVLYIANMLSGGHIEWSDPPAVPQAPELARLMERFEWLRPEIAELSQRFENELA